MFVPKLPKRSSNSKPSHLFGSFSVESFLAKLIYEHSFLNWVDGFSGECKLVRAANKAKVRLKGIGFIKSSTTV